MTQLEAARQGLVTDAMKTVAAEENVGLVAYTITHHTRQSALGLPFIAEEEFSETHTVTEVIREGKDD